jgi:hypothetical protein
LNESGAISVDLQGQPAGALQAHALDDAGNISRTVTYRLRHKQKQHEVSIKKEDLFGELASFKFPESLSDFIAVVRSLTGKALERKIITPTAADKMKAALDDIKKG